MNVPILRKNLAPQFSNLDIHIEHLVELNSNGEMGYEAFEIIAPDSDNSVILTTASEAISLLDDRESSTLSSSDR